MQKIPPTTTRGKTAEMQKQFMVHLFSQGFTTSEIASVYRTTNERVEVAINNVFRKVKK